MIRGDSSETAAAGRLGDALVKASHEGELSHMVDLLARGASPSVENWKPCVVAAGAGRSEAMRILLEAESHPRFALEECYVAATARGMAEAVELALKELGGSVSQKAALKAYELTLRSIERPWGASAAIRLARSGLLSRESLVGRNGSRLKWLSAVAEESSGAMRSSGAMELLNDMVLELGLADDLDSELEKDGRASIVCEMLASRKLRKRLEELKMGSRETEKSKV